MASEAIEYVRDRPTPRLEAFDLADLVDEVGVILQEQGEDADPNLLRNWVNGLTGECKVRADRDLLYRVFINLGRNAFDAGANTVTVRTQNGGAYLLVDVADNGPGVPKHVTEQLFKPFTTGGRAGGAGLGLAIARDLVRCHGGEIAMTETGAEGTTFRFTLPAIAH
jgi:signal transduction histidine kinase